MEHSPAAGIVRCLALAAVAASPGALASRHSVAARKAFGLGELTEAWAADMKALLSTGFLQPPVASMPQVPQGELDQLSKRLSKKCEERFAAVLKGEGGKLNVFGEGGRKVAEETCHGLNGTICLRQAHIVQTQTRDGRKVRQSTEVEGHGCIPSECLDAADLQELTNFMQVQAQGSIPRTGTEVGLRINCSESGGSVVSSGFAASLVDAEAKKPKFKAQALQSPLGGAKKSAAASVAISISTVLAGLGAVTLCHAISL